MGDPEIHEEVEQVVEDRLGGPPHGQQVSESLQYFILIPAVLAFILIGMICYTVTYELYYIPYILVVGSNDHNLWYCPLGWFAYRSMVPCCLHCSHSKQ